MKHTENNVENDTSAPNEKKFVSRYIQFKPLFDRSEVNRDNFIKLRKELIALGCHHDQVIDVAKKLSMDVLEIKSEDEYNLYIMQQTFDKTNKIIKDGYNHAPIQDLNSQQYSHADLFSSIYGFELDYLGERKITDGIVDIGCGDGLFLRLLKDHGYQARGYEVEIKHTCHNVTIDKIEDIRDIHEPGKAVILNHVLEHVEEHPGDFICRMMDHFYKLGKDRLQTIIISLPIHLSLHAHLASDHRWLCWDDEISDEMKESFENEGLKLFRPALEFSRVAKARGYRLKVYKNRGTYVFE